MRPIFVLISCALVLGACAQPPVFDHPHGQPAAQSSPPDLVPLAPLLAQAEARSRTSAPVLADMNGRLAALRARAAGLRGPVIPSAQAARMRRAMR